MSHATDQAPALKNATHQRPDKGLGAGSQNSPVVAVGVAPAITLVKREQSGWEMSAYDALKVNYVDQEIRATLRN